MHNRRIKRERIRDGTKLINSHSTPPTGVGQNLRFRAAATAEGIGVSNVGGKSVGGIRVGDAVAVGTGSGVGRWGEVVVYRSAVQVCR